MHAALKPVRDLVADKARCSAGWALVCLALCAPAWSADSDGTSYPAHTVHVVVGNLMGTASDVTARLYSQRLAESLGQPFEVENRPSSGALIAGEFVARSSADGYTLLFATGGLMVNAPLVYSRIPFSIERDFAPISMASRLPVVLVANPALEVKSVRELIAHARAHPARATYGAGGVSLQLAGALFATRTRLALHRALFPTGAAVVRAVAQGEVAMAFVDGASATHGMRNGGVRAFAVASGTRSALLPGIPTLAESGVRGANMELWIGLFAPAGTPAQIIARLQTEMMKIARLPDTRERLAALSAEPVGSTAEEFAQAIAIERARLRSVAANINIASE